MSNGNQTFTWIHLSDWHEGKPDPLPYDRGKLRERLLQDIERRVDFDPRLSEIDAFIFSGDIAWSGQWAELEKANSELVQPVRERLGRELPLICVPGNHDLDRNRHNDPTLNDTHLRWNEILRSKSNRSYREIGDILFGNDSRDFVLGPFANFYKFSKGNGFEYVDGPVKATYFPYGKKKNYFGIAAINSAICCSRSIFVDSSAKEGEKYYWDYGLLSISEQQIDRAMDLTRNCAIRMLVLHHPINWTSEAERARIEPAVSNHFDILLHGHEHLPRFLKHADNAGELIVVPAGASYDARTVNDPRYSNSYNYGIVDLEDRTGTLIHRRWVEDLGHGNWEDDKRYWNLGRSKFVIHDRGRYNAENREYIYRVEKLYKDAFGKRPIKRLEISIKHSSINLNGSGYIVAHIHYDVEFAAGEIDDYTIRVSPNKRILASPDPEVAKMALYDFECSNLLAPKEYKGERVYVVTGKLPKDACSIQYEYKILECSDGVWFSGLNRFADYLKFNIMKADGYSYEDMPVGGAPQLKPGKTKGILQGETYNADEGHCPNQGYLIQWYRAAV